jgi:hypothetical protein
MNRRGFLAALGAACAAPITLARRAARPKCVVRIIDENGRTIKQVEAHTTQEALDLLWVVQDTNDGDWASDLNPWKSQAISENFRRTYGGDGRSRCRASR